MSNELPFVSCLCPTCRRPQMMGTTTLAFHGQDYPEDRRELIILDDAGELQNDSGGGWQIISIPRRFRSLPEKFNAIAGLAKGDILVVRGHDVWLPHHISTHVRAMEGRLWSKPSFVLSSYTGRLEQEDATGRFHASLAFRREIFDRIGGWPLTKRSDFDQQLIARLHAIEAPGDPCQFEIRRTSSAGARRTRTTGRRLCRDRRMRAGMTGCRLKFQARTAGCGCHSGAQSQNRESQRCNTVRIAEERLGKKTTPTPNEIRGS